MKRLVVVRDDNCSSDEISHHAIVTLHRRQSHSLPRHPLPLQDNRFLRIAHRWSLALRRQPRGGGG